MAERAGLFEEDLDLSQFTPHKPTKAEQPPARRRSAGRRKCQFPEQGTD